MKRICEYDFKEFEAKRKTARFCSDSCRVNFFRDLTKNFESKPKEDKESLLESRLGFKIDRSRPFTDEESEKVSKLPYAMRIEALARPGSVEWTEEQKLAHYNLKNFPNLTYTNGPKLPFSNK